METIKSFIVGAIAFSMILSLAIICGDIENTYYSDVEVVEIEGNIAVAEDEHGNLWEFEDDSLKVGDTFTIKLHNNHTEENFRDDKFIKIK